MNKSRKIKIIVSIIAISFIQGLQYCVSPVLSQIQEHYSDVSLNFVQMLITAPALLSMVVALVSGYLVLKISKKKLLVFAAGLAGITGLLPYLSDNFALLFTSRAIYGIALGLATTLNAAVVAEFFEGKERVSVMGIQAASVGAGMVIVSTGGGILGVTEFTHAYLINIIGFVSMVIIALLLPETGVVKSVRAEKIQLNGKVFKVAGLGMLECLFLITFTTNISMHISGTLAGSSSVSGILTGIFSASQIIVGLILGYITRITKCYTLPVAMLCFCVGAVFLILFPANYAILIIAAVFCGFSQGIFIPQAFVEVANAVSPVATAMASAVFTCAMCLGQFISPSMMNGITKLIFGDVTTTHVYMMAAIGMTGVALLVITAKKLNRQD